MSECRLEELQQLSYDELLAEQARLQQEIIMRKATVVTPANGQQPVIRQRFVRAAHDYLDVQHVLRHHPDRKEPARKPME
jgi:hypothetical protein